MKNKKSKKHKRAKLFTVNENWKSEMNKGKGEGA